MSEQRRCARRGNSWVVPVPRAIRQHLGVVHGGDLFWHFGPKGEAYVTNGRARIGGKPPGQRVEKNLAEARRTIERLERRLRNRPSVTFNEGVAEGFAISQRELVRVGAGLESLVREVRELGDRIPFRPRRHVSRARSVQTVSVDALAAAHAPAPEPSSPVVVAGGAAASGGAAPQAAHD